MKALVTKLFLVGVLATATSGIAMPAAQASTCAPSVFHPHITQYVNARYAGLVTSKKWISPPSNTIYNYGYKSTLSRSVATTSTISVGVTTGVAFKVSVSAIVAAADATTSLSVSTGVSVGKTVTITQTMPPRRWGYTRMSVPIYKFSGTLRTVDLTCGVIDWSEANHIVTIPGQAAVSGYDFAI